MFLFHDPLCRRKVKSIPEQALSSRPFYLSLKQAYVVLNSKNRSKLLDRMVRDFYKPENIQDVSGKYTTGKWNDLELEILHKFNEKLILAVNNPIKALQPKEKKARAKKEISVFFG